MPQSPPDSDRPSAASAAPPSADGRPPRGRRPGPLAVALVLLVGAVVGLGSFTFGYGEGFSYLSTDPDSCLNCHVMQEYHDSWQGGSHRHVATCIDCHLPHETIPKYIAKADNGFFHSLAFTLENYHEPIQIKDRNARILQESCEHCHEATVHAMSTTFLAAASESAAAGEVACIHCHHRVGHGPS